MKIGIVAGEASGNVLGAGLIHALQARQPDLQTSGVGGQDMIEAGFQSFHDMDRLAVMGLIEPLGRLPELIRIRRQLYKHFTRHKPDVFIGIDSPDFNLGLEKKLRDQGIKTVHYVSPSVWAWRKKRIHKIAKAVDLVLTLFPFEAAFYEQHDVRASFVGHPLADLVPLVPDAHAAKVDLGLDPEKTYLALLPGSRRNEIHLLAETFIKTAQLCLREKPELRFITSAANMQRNQEFQAHCQRLAPDLPIHFYQQRTHEVMAAADVVLVTSGTATLETMLFKRPMVVAYKLGNLTYQIARHLVKLPYFSLPNLLAAEKLIPEFIQDQATPDQLAKALLNYLEYPEKTRLLLDTFTRIHQQLRCDANHSAATAVLSILR
ncbi:MAG: lipid-A-disaccharide synthase [Pseudomonadota bacterium]